MNKEMMKIMKLIDKTGYKIEFIKDLDTPYSMRDDEDNMRLKGFDIRISSKFIDKDENDPALEIINTTRMIK